MSAIDRKGLLAYMESSGIHLASIAQYAQDAAGRTLYIPSSHGWTLLSADYDRPFEVPIPRKFGWDDVWVDSKGKVHELPPYAIPQNGKDLDLTKIDWQSGYFFQREIKDDGKQTIYIGRMNDTARWTSIIPISDNFYPTQLFVRNGILYLIDYSDAPNYPFLSSKSNCRAYRPNLSQCSDYIPFDDFRINGRVKAVDPSSQRLLCQSFAVAPFSANYFVYDLAKHREICQLKAGMLYAFLDGDWLLQNWKGNRRCFGGQNRDSRPLQSVDGE